jgi:hypothetical protein
MRLRSVVYSQGVGSRGACFNNRPLTIHEFIGCIFTIATISIVNSTEQLGFGESIWAGDVLRAGFTTGLVFLAGLIYLNLARIRLASRSRYSQLGGLTRSKRHSHTNLVFAPAALIGSDAKSLAADALLEATTVCHFRRDKRRRPFASHASHAPSRAGPARLMGSRIRSNCTARISLRHFDLRASR